MRTLDKKVSEIYRNWWQQKLNEKDKLEYYYHLYNKRQYNLEINRTKTNLVKLKKCLETIQQLEPEYKQK
jgi:hypothetical protein